MPIPQQHTDVEGASSIQHTKQETGKGIESWFILRIVLTIGQVRHMLDSLGYMIRKLLSWKSRPSRREIFEATVDKAWWEKTSKPLIRKSEHEHCTT